MGVIDDRPSRADGIGPVGRALAIAIVVAFTWWVERGFKALFDAVS
jgi:hypothetical protein